ncbi:hypothetical protein N7931_19185 [Catenovulum sp. 2E275]|uniref:hypothetical protein n=1 Tax=Catenovulum sp. 2E275 TaxID=2980497 RepID=UPI0021D2645D|nr:hypothetical protein [Catenovulum sp. 2E275]MCU4677736.1 hypothetical protein [Catenovulum sp. 2E275]
MKVTKVACFKCSWDQIQIEHSFLINEMMSTLDQIVLPSKIENKKHTWRNILIEHGWNSIAKQTYSSDGRALKLSLLGPIKNGICVSLNHNGKSELLQWLFKDSALAFSNELIDLSILILPTRRLKSAPILNWFKKESFENFYGQLVQLSPFEVNVPFILIGVDLKNDSEFVKEFNLEPFDAWRDVYSGCIEFPPEYHSAGLGILNYFGTYLREQYPDEEAKVRIEQDGLMVRLIIQTKSGKSDVVEKALHEYELVVKDSKYPDTIKENEKLFLEQRNELRIAELRVESQKDIINVQDKRIDKLLDMVGGFFEKSQSISIDFRPVLSNHTTLQVNQHVYSAIETIEDLLKLLPNSSVASRLLRDVESSLDAIEHNNTPEEVRRSPAMSKFRKVLENIFDKSSDVKNSIENINKGIEYARDLARKYNKIAEWCGLPVFPSDLLK